MSERQEPSPDDAHAACASEPEPFHFEIPPAYQEAIKTLHEEMVRHKKLMRDSQDDYIAARDSLWDHIFEVVALDRNDPRAPHLLYKPEEGIVVEMGRSRAELTLENEELREMNAALAASIDAKSKLVREQRYAGAAKARDIESTIRSFVSDFKNIEGLLAEIKDLNRRINALEGDTSADT